MYNSKKWVPVQPWWYVIMCAGLQVPTESTTATGIKGTGPIFIFYTPPFIDATSWMGFPGGSDDKESACSAWEAGSIPGSRRSPGVGNGNPLQYSCLENPRDRGAWWATSMGCKDSDMTERLNMHVYNEDINSIFHRVMVWGICPSSHRFCLR